MKVLRFNKHFYDEMNSWYTKRELPILIKDILPNTGFIVSEVAAGFLYCCDGNLGLIENFITNPDAKSEDRDEAINIIIDSIEQEAKILGIKYIIGSTKEDSLLMRSLNLNYKDLGKYNLIFKNL